jgi:transcriptional regulator with XRE-family HTH domain
LTDQVRQAVAGSGLSRYRICKLARIDQATFSRFMAGKVGLSLLTLDALADVLGLDVVGDAGLAGKDGEA